VAHAGVFCGISSGCNVAAANKLAAALPDSKVIVTMINDTGMRYFSTPLFGHEAFADIPDRPHSVRESDTLELARRNLHIVH
jgi:cysteine synthase A